MQNFSAKFKTEQDRAIQWNNLYRMETPNNQREDKLLPDTGSNAGRMGMEEDPRKRKRDPMDQNEDEDDSEELEWREVLCPHCKGCVKYCLKIDNHTQHWVQLLFHIFTLISVWSQWVLTST